ncbi:MAG: type III PLP-dependent enzyme [Dehalococcoidia bacterium]|nr:type III PLP-dependent enzyme [Dehalococcoidia bacterium]
MSTNLPTAAVPESVLRLAQNRKTPFLAIDEKSIRDKFQQFREALPACRIFYAVKANSHKRIVKTMHAMGSDFEIASEEELNLLLDCGIAPQKIITSNPVKSVPFIQACHQAGVMDFAFDSLDEIEKLSRYAPGSRVYVRLTVSNEGSQWPLSRKFGVEIDEAAELLITAAKRSLVPYGLTFHVGSQCTNEIAWVNAISKSKRVWDMTAAKGVKLRMLNIGGGFPIHYTDAIPPLSRISRAIEKTVGRDFLESTEVFVEPGRVFVGEAGILVTTVIGKARRGEQNWLYLDVGVFNGLMESVGGFRYSMVTHREGPTRKWVVAGPSCDSMDVISNDKDLPELEIGDKVYILSAGAYTTVYASRFNGFPIPKTYFL